MLDTGPGALDRITRLARHLADVPVAAISVGAARTHAVDDSAPISSDEIHALSNALDAVDAPRILDDLMTTHPTLAGDTGLQAVVATPVRDPLGQRLGLLWVATPCLCALREDIVEQLDTLAWLTGAWLHATRSSEFETSAVPPVEPRHYGLVLTNPDGHILWANEGFVELCGYPVDELIGRRPGSFLQGPATDASAVDAMRTHIHAGRGFEAELVNYRKSGEPYWVQIQAEPIHDKQGELAGFIALETDVSAQHILSDDSTFNRRRVVLPEHRVLNVALDTVDALVVVTDVDGHIVRCNEACRQRTGSVSEELIGASVIDRWVPDEDAATVEAVLDAHRAGQTESAFECRWDVRDDENRLIDWSITAVVGAEGAAQYLVWAGVDITERQKLEQELMEVSSEERRRIGQDLHDILASHLAGTAMVAQSLSRKRARGETISVDDLDLIVDHINEAARQTRALSHSLMPERVESSQLADALRQLAQNKEELTGIQHTVDVQADATCIDDATATHLYRIAYEAVNNAIKHADPSQVHMQLRREAGRLHLVVQDDGLGIECLDDVSPGLGLRMMQHRANLIDAHLDVRPVDTGGTQVRCTVPLRESNDADERCQG
jgi:PAS domain S-box-containing protein